MRFWKKKEEQEVDPTEEIEKAIDDLYDDTFRNGRSVIVLHGWEDEIKEIGEHIQNQKERISDLKLKNDILRDDNLALRAKLEEIG